MNLVVGATGLTGIDICRRLIAAGRPVRALYRPTSNPERIAELERLGAEMVRGDLKDRASLDAACRGMESVISTATITQSRLPGDSIETVDRQGHTDLIDAASGAGVERFVYVSFRNAHVDYPLALAKGAVEEHLQHSGMIYTSLQGSWFNEVWLTPKFGFDYRIGEVKIYGEGENRISWVSYEDVARFAALSLDNPYAANAILEIGGPEPLSPLQVVAIFEDVTGREFSVEHVSTESLQAMRDNAEDPLQESFAGAMLHYASGDEIDMSETAAAFGLELVSIRDYAESVAGRQDGDERPDNILFTSRLS